MKIGKSQLPKLLANRGLTQQQLSERTGLSPTQISDYVSGRRTMSLKNAKLISGILGCQIEELYDWSGNQDGK